jgi:hypothetical protein
LKKVDGRDINKYSSSQSHGTYGTASGSGSHSVLFAERSQGVYGERKKPDNRAGYSNDYGRYESAGHKKRPPPDAHSFGVYQVKDSGRSPAKNNGSYGVYQADDVKPV